MGWITNTIDYLRDFNLISVIVRFVLAIILSSSIGIEREKHGRAAGLRTHILVCLGATIASMTGVFIVEGLGSGDASRIAAQVISGIGFLGAGTILIKNKSVVTGLTTAAGVWTVGVVGIAIGYGFYEGAIVGAIIASVVTGKLGVMNRKFFAKSREAALYVEFIDARKLNETLNIIKEKGYAVLSIHLTPSNANTPNSIGADIIIKSTNQNTIEQIVDEINGLDNVNFAIITI